MLGLLFAGGVGQRLWPLSRKNKPKQFLALDGGTSTLAQAAERLKGLVKREDLYVATNVKFKGQVLKQVPWILPGNLILEPERRDLAAAAALAFAYIAQKGGRGPLFFQWTDCVVTEEKNLLRGIRVAGELIASDPGRIVFIGQQPRFPNENLGWIRKGPLLGKIDGVPFFGFSDWVYRPKAGDCLKMFRGRRYIWNCGFFLSSIEFLLAKYRLLAPEIMGIAQKIVSSSSRMAFNRNLKTLYPSMPAMHFDESFLMRIGHEEAVLLCLDLGWSDPGTLYALKESLARDEKENVVKGRVVETQNTDCLFLNEEKKVLCGMGLDGLVVVNLKDALLVVSKNSVRSMKTLLEKLDSMGYQDVL